jgi:hypothetical protein
VYGYNEADIVVMLDGGKMVDPQLAPTRENMVRNSVNVVIHQKIIYDHS